LIKGIKCVIFPCSRVSLTAAINQAAEAWGVLCLRYEIKNIEVPESVKHAMQMQVEAERKKRAHILESEGEKTSKINIAEGGIYIT
jgi:regulator of protease activity HflC (stomatin/prohibitin superfamily)